MPTLERDVETEDPWNTAPSLETWARCAEQVSDDRTDEPHILRGLE